MMVALRSMSLLLITLMFVCEVISAKISGYDSEEQYEPNPYQQLKLNQQIFKLMDNFNKILKEVKPPPSVKSRMYKREIDDFVSIFSLQKQLYNWLASFNLMAEKFLVNKPQKPAIQQIKAWKRNADLINSILALPKGMNDAGR